MFKWFADAYQKKWQLLILFVPVWLVMACTSPAEPTPVRTDPGPAECDQRVLVVVWSDLNGDGVQDPSEPTLENVLLRITAKDDPAGDGIQLSTGENGRAHFPTRELENCQTTGYQMLFLRQVAGYEFPAQPVVDLDDFDPLNDAVHFGLLPANEDSN